MDAIKVLGSLLGNNATSSGLGGQILGQLLSGLTGGEAALGGRAASGGLADILSSLTGGGALGGRAAGGGLADILSSLTGGGALGGRAAGGGLADILSSLTGGGGLPVGSQGGSNSGLLGGLVMAALQMFTQSGGAAGQPSLSGLAGMAAPGPGTPAAMDATQAHQQALILIKAMINAAKADGQIDAEEQQKIVAKLGDIDPQEATFIHEEISKPLNFDFFAGITPDLAPQAYAVSLMAINLDTPAESNYLQQLAQGLGLDAQAINGIHAQLGLAPLYS